MIYNIYFEVSALCFMLITFVFHLFQFKTVTVYNKKFRILLAMGIAADFFDFYTAVTISYYKTIPIPVNIVLNAINFVLMAATGYSYCTYVVSVLGIGEKTRGMLINKIILIVFILLSVANMFFGFFFYFDPEVGYQHGKLYLAQMTVSYYFVLYALQRLIANRKHIEKRVTYSAGVYAVVIFVCAVVQVVFVPNVLLYGFGVGLATTIVFFSLESPDYYKLKVTMEELERSKEEAVRANRAKSTFLAQMSHEIRTPINAVLGMNEMICRESDEENIREYAGKAYNAGKALLSIINDILDISKIEAGKLEIVEAEYELHSLVSDCCLMVADRAEKKGLSLSAKCDESLPSKLYGDMVHIRQIAMNFLTNAIKYTDKGYVKITFSGEEKNGVFSLRISVRDTGIGLTEENREKLFSRFQRFELERNQFVEGTGLGLSICKQLTELMNGTIEVNSVYGEGSEFICTVPQKITDSTPVGKIQPERTEKIKIPEERTFISPTSHILAVDDIEMNLVVLAELLKYKKMRIDTALSGKEALEMIKEKKYDLIFMDHMMPEMDGIETFNIMKDTEHKNKETPVVMLTANAITGEREKYLDIGFSAYLTKPLQNEELDEILLELLPKEKLIWTENKKTPSSADISSVRKRSSRLIDARLGLRYNAENENVYREVLKSYVKSGEEMLSKIRRFYENGDIDNYTIEVHALKSTSLTIGAKGLSDAAKELETAGKNKDYDLINDKTDDLLLLFDEVLSESGKLLEQYFPETESTEDINSGEVTEISAEAFSEILRGITDACLEYDSDRVLELCREAYAYSCQGTPLRQLLDGVKTSAEDFECEAAAEKAEEVMQSLSKAL